MRQEQRGSRMKKFSTILLVVLSCGLAATALGQYKKPSGVSIRGGMFFPSAKAAQAEGHTWFGVGLDYKLKDLGYAAGMTGFDRTYSVSIDYYGKGDYSNIPVMLNYVARGERFYYGAGAGLGIAQTPDGSGGTNTNTEFVYQLSVGMDFQRGMTPVFVEVRFFGSAESLVSGFGVFAGMRF